jgi:UDP-N-acetylglucosamine 2-epimerase
MPIFVNQADDRRTGVAGELGAHSRTIMESVVLVLQQLSSVFHSIACDSLLMILGNTEAREAGHVASFSRSLD